MKRLVLLVGLAAVACGQDRVEHVDPGRACLVADAADVEAFGQPGSTTLPADAEAVVVVVVSECSSGSTLWESRCDAVVNGLDIQVSAQATSWTPRDQTDDCQFVTVTCPVSALSAETYTLVYGGASEEVTLPYTGEPVCVSSPLRL